MGMNTFWNRLFGGREEPTTSKSVAKERLRLVLVHDRLDMSEQVMDALREDLIAVINKYMEIDVSGLDVSLTREDDGVALIANIPILSVRRSQGDNETAAKSSNATTEAATSSTDKTTTQVPEAKPKDKSAAAK